jgi:hypothetical protein
VYITCVAVNTTLGMDGLVGEVPAGTVWIEMPVSLVDQIISKKSLAATVNTKFTVINP